MLITGGEYNKNGNFRQGSWYFKDGNLDEFIQFVVFESSTTNNSTRRLINRLNINHWNHFLLNPKAYVRNRHGDISDLFLNTDAVYYKVVAEIKDEQLGGSRR